MRILSRTLAVPSDYVFQRAASMQQWKCIPRLVDGYYCSAFVATAGRLKFRGMKKWESCRGRLRTPVIMCFNARPECSTGTVSSS